jgi:hypothetical protein
MRKGDKRDVPNCPAGGGGEDFFFLNVQVRIGNFDLKIMVLSSAILFLLGWRSENVHNDWRPEPGRNVQEGHKNGAGSHGTLQDLARDPCQKENLMLSTLYFFIILICPLHIASFYISPLQFSTTFSY